MPPQIIAIGMPACEMVIMRLQVSVNMSADMPSIGMMRQVMPSAVISQLTRHIIGIIMPAIIAIGMPAIIGLIIIMGFIIGFIMPAIIAGVMPPAVGIPAGIVMGISMGIGIIPLIICNLLARTDRCSPGSGT